MLCDALHAAFRWTGDVVTLERSVLEQANSRYEVQGEYVLPGMRDWDRDRDSSSVTGMAHTPDATATASATASHRGSDWDAEQQRAMPGQLHAMMTSIGRWRMRLDVPHADISEMLPGLRILSRSHDPAVLFRSKELFLHGIEGVGFASHSLQHQLEYVREKREREWEPAGADVGGGAAVEALPGLLPPAAAAGAGAVQQHGGLHVERLLLQKDDGATVHADGTLFGPAPNLHFALLNFPPTSRAAGGGAGRGARGGRPLGLLRPATVRNPAAAAGRRDSGRGAGAGRGGGVPDAGIAPAVSCGAGARPGGRAGARQGQRAAAAHAGRADRPGGAGGGAEIWVMEGGGATSVGSREEEKRGGKAGERKQKAAAEGKTRKEGAGCNAGADGREQPHMA
ncbi:hypothetical protein CLOP_g10110 [Closterium sp. NIES-67]|nr:hypothetical protein CLOP_g10110 [Closterium sp. NIES-67]